MKDLSTIREGTAVTIQKCSPKFCTKFYHRHLRKILLFGLCVGVILIIVYTDEFFYEEPSSEVRHPFAVDSQQHQLWMKIMNVRMEKRKRSLQEKCKLLKLNVPGNDSLHKPNEWEFLINRPYHLIWCQVFKAASTSWMYNFNILAGYTPTFLQHTKEVPLELARRKYRRPSLKSLREALNDSTSFLIVRHPFERLLSGYRDKIEFAWPNTHHYKLGNYIIKKYRRPLGKKPGKPTIFSFFKRNQERPTFVEFVQFIIHLHQSGRPMDMHWIPITNFCTPCQVRFDIIMKFETLQEDQNYLIQKIKLQDLITPQWKNPTKGRKRVIDLLKKYYAQLNISQILQLYNMYRYDFYLFDYKVDDYLQYINFNKTESFMNEFEMVV